MSMHGKESEHVFSSKNIDSIGVSYSSRESMQRGVMLTQSASNNATNFGIHILTLN